VPMGCHLVPFCIPCTRQAVTTRVARSMNQFSMCTPRGQPMRFIHIVQTSPLTDDGHGWGLKASWNPRRFARIVWTNLQDAYGDAGPGLGGVLSYQDF